MQNKKNKTKNKRISLTTLSADRQDSPAYNLTSLRGFSLIELIIVVAIMMVVTSATLFRQAKFSSDILITNMAYEIALSVRQAAVFGLSSRANSEIAYRTGYGVHFGPIPEDGLEADEAFRSFIEVSGTEISTIVQDNDVIFDYFYNFEEDVSDETNELTQGQKIKRYCARVSSSSSWVCGDPDGQVEMSIVYVKPNPEAHITMGADGVRTADIYNEAIIVVESALGDKCRTVFVSVSGQISVEPVDPDDVPGCARGTE